MLIKRPITKMTGLTLLETMFALAVGAFVLIAVVIVYKSIRQSANISQTVTDLNAIRAGYKSYLASGYKFDTTNDEAQLQAVQDAGFLPDLLNTPWGQPYVVSLKYTTKQYADKGLSYIMISIPGLGRATDDDRNDPRCMSVWKAVVPTGGIYVNNPNTSDGYGCAFWYQFP